MSFTARRTRSQRPSLCYQNPHDGNLAAGAEDGFDYENPEDVTAATIVGITEGSLSVIRGGENRSQQIALNRNSPAAVDEILNARKPQIEQAVASHSSL